MSIVNAFDEEQYWELLLIKIFIISIIIFDIIQNNFMKKVFYYRFWRTMLKNIPSFLYKRIYL